MHIITPLFMIVWVCAMTSVFLIKALYRLTIIDKHARLYMNDRVCCVYMCGHVLYTFITRRKLYHFTISMAASFVLNNGKRRSAKCSKE